MFASPKLMGVFVGFAVALLADNSGAVSVKVAKKCDALTAKAFPPRVTGPEIRAYYNKCVANRGQMPDEKP
jgi:hypothetical protein